MKTLEHVFTHSRGQCSVRKSGDFLYLFGAIVGDFVQTKYPIIK